MSRSPHGNLAIPCQNCHTSVGWKPIRAVPEFDHNKTRYPLRGLHENVACTQCHAKPVFSNVGSQCADCHADIHRRQMGANCEQCHTVKGWNIVLQKTREHDNRFPLVGGHAGLDCADCHKSAAVGQFQGLSVECYSCHQSTYKQTTAPSHTASPSAFPVQCEQCHSMNSWLGAKFNHSFFPLTGMHATLDCTACHIGGKYQGTPATCVGCHLPDYQKASNPNHIALGLPQTCQECHSTSAWQPANFNHDTVGFPLTGGHAKLQCDQCHTNGNFNLTTTACVSCHLKDYQGTTNPNHVSAAFPQQCELCHNTTTWTNATFNHASTGWPLTGAHTTLQCTQCHTNGNYSLTSTACVTCHLPDFNGTTNPNHVSAGFPQQCDVCHTTSAWSPATFNHNNTSFPLTGAHTTVACANCHVNNNYTTVPTDCYGCHKADYTGTTNPNHVAVGFPTTCATCHTTTSWAGATFNHTWFNMNHGGANGVCSTCHTNPNDYSVFQCTNCHSKANTDNQHRGVGAYVYNSVNCYQCHRR